jgi:formylglycine-generating enzyme required for sulfatase activity
VGILKIIAVWLAFLWCLVPAHAEKRVALVIGNDHYANLPPNEQLQKAVNDARAVGGALKQIGFDVLSGENLGRQAVLARIDEAAQRLTVGDTVFFFFSGHGVAVDGFNYILPVDVPAVGSGKIVSLIGAAIKEEDITAAFLRAGARVAVVVLDACRNNPFASSWTKGVGGEKGLAPHEPPSGVFTLYAASRGEAALDRLYDGDRNPNSVFTRVLVPALTRPDLDLPALAREVREEVTRLARTVNHAQRPAYYDETSGDRIFLAGGSRLGGGAQPQPAGPAVALISPPIAPAAPAPDLCNGPVTASFPSRCAAPLSAAQERGLKPKDTFRECENCPEMVVVPAGSFTMGSPAGEKDREPREGPQHDVTIGRPFAMGKLHITVDQFAVFVRDTAYVASSTCGIFEDGQWRESTGHSWRNPGFEQEGLHPVVCVNLADAKAYVDWLVKRTGKSYRLPSEAEWEYAARGRTSPGAYPRFWFGDDEKDLCRYGNGADQKARDNVAGAARWTIAPCNDGYAYTSPGGHFTPNAFGLYDMFGNAWQLTADCEHENYNGAPADGTAWTTPCEDNDFNVVRGGSWDYGPWSLRAASRQMWGFYPFIGIGFRVARTLAP